MSLLWLWCLTAGAEPATRGSGAVRVGAGAGVSEIGASGRVGLEGEVWIWPRLGVGARGGGGIDGFDQGRLVLLVEALVPVRVVGGEELALVLTPGFGVVDRFHYGTALAVSTQGVAASTRSTERGFASSASLTADLYGRMGILALTLGPRLETYAFDTVSATLQFGVGVGW